MPEQTAPVFRVAKNGDAFLGGNVGIGTASPESKLDVGGQIRSRSGGFVFPDGSVQTTAVDTPAAPLWIFNGTDIYRVGSNVGIGTTSPSFRLDVAGAIRASSAPAIFGPRADLLIGTTNYDTGEGGCGLLRCPPQTTFRVDGFGNIQTNRLGVGGFAANDGYPRGWAGGIHAFDIYAEGSVGLGRGGSVNALIGPDGAGRFTVVRVTGGSDLSEQFDVRATPQPGRDAAPGTVAPGMVVSIDPDNPGKLAVSAQAYDRRVAGIISGAGGVNPGMLMGQAGTLVDGQHPVALTGRVYVWADASSGTIVPGDLLTTSSIPGHAMKVTNHGQAQGAILGKAMTGLKEGKGLVLVLVTLQ